MDYPFWDVGLGYGVLMATFAILHVFVSHFAIGGGLYLVGWNGARVEAVTRNACASCAVPPNVHPRDAGLRRAHGRRHLVHIGLIGPNATAALIHTFVWGWAIEWTFFLSRSPPRSLLRTDWDRMSARGHQALG